MLPHPPKDPQMVKDFRTPNEVIWKCIRRLNKEANRSGPYHWMPVKMLKIERFLVAGMVYKIRVVLAESTTRHKRPIVVRHVIDESSPFHGLTREQLHSSEFELIMTVEGIVEATGMTFQARTSFLPDEILWGYRFKPMVVLNDERCKYEVHYGLFDQTERVRGFENNLTEAEETDEMDPHNASGFL